MKDRATRFNNLMLSPGVSVIFALAGLTTMLPCGAAGWVGGLLSAAIGALMVYQIKARALYRGANFPFLGLFMLLQAAVAPTLTGCLTAAMAAVAMTALFLCFSRPRETRVFFTVFLFCGLGALWARSFLLLGAGLIVAQVLVRAFSMRGFVAAMLGLITPLVIAAGFGLYTPDSLLTVYSQGMTPGINAPTVFTGAVALLLGFATFLQSYGYPAKSRARNMAMLGLTGCAVLMPVIDSANYADYLPLINFCGAYNVSHFAATRRFGWLCALAVAIAATAFYIWFR